jgi:hypothetical protein
VLLDLDVAIFSIFGLIFREEVKHKFNRAEKRIGSRRLDGNSQAGSRVSNTSNPVVVKESVVCDNLLLNAECGKQEPQDLNENLHF